MICTEISRLPDMVQGTLTAAEDGYIKGVEIDTRKLKPGMLFVPLIGARVDGHDLLDQAIQAGVKAALWQKDHPIPQTDLPLIVVDNTENALQQLAKAYLQETGAKVIGITGSNGKTSTKDMMASVLRTSYRVHQTPGNRNNQIGMPLTILEMDEDTQFVILEMGMENFHEIQLLTSIAPPDYAIITSVGSAHMENLGSLDGIARAKLEIYEGLNPKGVLYYNHQSEPLKRQLAQMDDSKRRVSFGQGGQLYLESAPILAENGIEFQVSSLKEPVFLPSFGQFMAENALPVIGLAQEIGLSEEQIREGLKQVQLTGMRTSVKPVKAGRILDDTYKSNPESAQAAIDTLLSLPGRPVAILADMFDLGADSLKLHAQVGRYAREKGVSQLLTLGEQSQATAQAFGENARWFASRQDLIETARPLLLEDVTILIKGSRGMHMDDVVEALLREE